MHSGVPIFVNLSKQLVKSPKVYVCDSGLLHSLLSIHEVNDLLGHPSTGGAWEGFAIEQITNRLPKAPACRFNEQQQALKSTWWLSAVNEKLVLKSNF